MGTKTLSIQATTENEGKRQFHTTFHEHVCHAPYREDSNIVANDGIS